MVDAGKRTARPDEYRVLLNNSAHDVEDREMLDQLLSVSQEMTGITMVAGNACQLLIDGPATFKMIFADIKRARESIHLETFILEDDKIGRQLAEQLILAKQRGLSIRILIDAVGSFNLPADFVGRLTGHGIELRKFHPVDPAEDPRIWRFNNRDHRKILVIDGRVAYTGGINISGVYSKGSLTVPRKKTRGNIAWRDTHVRVTGPVVHQFQKNFLEMWNKDLTEAERVKDAGYFPVIAAQGDMVVGVAAHNGGDAVESDIYSVMAAAIGHAQKRIWITQAYFVPDEAFIEIIRLAAKRGVDVRLMLPGVSDAPLVIQASRSSYEVLLEAGVKIYERTDAVLHAKTVVVDSVWSSIGSTNYDYRSFVHNYELNAVIVNKDFGNAMEQLFQKDIQQAGKITLQAWRQRPFIQRLKEGFGGLLRHWL